MSYIVYAVIVEELYYYSYRLLVVEKGEPEASPGERVIELMKTSSSALSTNDLERAHQLVYGYLDQEYDPEIANLYVVLSDRPLADPCSTVVE